MQGRSSGLYSRLALRNSKVAHDAALNPQDELGAPEGWTDAQAEPAVGLPKQELAIQVELTRGHAAAESAPATPTAENPQGSLRSAQKGLN